MSAPLPSPRPPAHSLAPRISVGRIAGGRIPAHSLHKPSGRGRVRIDGRDHYTGTWGTALAAQRYDQLITEWLANGRRLPGSPQVLTVRGLTDLFNTHAKAYYGAKATGAGSVGSGRSCEAGNFAHAFKPLLTLYSSLPADALGPAQLKAVRQAMIAGGWVRNTINSRIKRIRHLYRWAVSESLVPPACIEALRSVPALARGRSAAPESMPVRPVPEATIAATMKRLASEPAAIVEMLLLTGARPGEIVGMRLAQIESSSDPWVYRPERHKTAHHGHVREIFLNSRAQELVRARLTLDPAAPIFRNRNGRAFTVDSLLTHIARAAERAKVPHWSPNQLRHNVATELRRRHGLDVAAAVLGHARMDTSLIYAEAPRAKAIDAVKQLTG